MGSIDVFMDLQHADNRRLQGARNDRGHRALPRGDVWLERILENLHTTSLEEVFRRIAALSDIRRGKVLDIRRRLTEGTYEAAERLDTAMDRVLEAITDPEGKDLAVGVTAEGRKKWEELFRRSFEKK